MIIAVVALQRGASGEDTRLLNLWQYHQDVHMEIAVLKRGFKATCRATDNKFQNYQIRVHRSLSWLGRCLEMDEGQQPEGRLLYAWIALSALYGRWDKVAGHAARDAEARNGFIAKLLEIDKPGLVAEQLQTLEKDILWILENRFLDPRFWRDPLRSGNYHARHHQGERLYREGRWGAILECTLERIAVLRGQIVHGAATRGSRLNRQSLQKCRRVLETLLPTILRLVIERRADDDWPLLCYPPIDD